MQATQIARARVTPIPRRTLTAAAFEQLMSNVVTGVWKPGDRIPPERELCQQLAIARTSLREALKAMELVGVLECRVGDGTFVCERSEFLSRPLLWALTGGDHVELADIMEARMLIERDLAGLAAARATDEEVAAVGQQVEAMRQGVGGNRELVDLDMAFHLAIARAAHNDVLHNAVQLLRNVLRQWIALKLLLPSVPDRVLAQHAEIYEAIRARDSERARMAMWEHLQVTARLLVKLAEEHRAG